MCKFFSVIVTKKSIVWDIDIDNHTTLLEKAGIKDEKKDPNFVRVELLPKDSDVFNHDLKNWKLHVDQDFKPDWFDENDAEKRVKKLVGEVFVGRFIKSKIKEITAGRWFLGTGGTIQYVSGGTIQYVSGGTIQYVSGGTIQCVSGGTIQYVNFLYPGKIEKITEGGIVIFKDGDSKRIVVADKRIKLEIFK